MIVESVSLEKIMSSDTRTGDADPAALPHIVNESITDQLDNVPASEITVSVKRCVNDVKED